MRQREEQREEEEEKIVQVLVVQEAEDLEEDQQREDRVQVLQTSQVNIPTTHTNTQKTTRASILLHLRGIL